MSRSSSGNPQHAVAACFLVAFAVLTSTVALAVPGEATNLQWCSGPKNCLQWNSVTGALQYRLYRGEQASLPCVINPALDSCDDGQFATTTTGSSVTESPAAARFFWFLVTAVDGSGEGSYGLATVGPRQSQHPGTCMPTCAPAASGCSNGTDCCSSSCIAGTCQTACCMAAGGSPCGTGADCCSGQCSASTCQAPCIPPGGGSCLAANQCCGIANGTPACQANQCVVGSCNPGFANCNQNAADGCEINTTNDTSNCGLCGLTCAGANGTPTCQNSVCGITCNPGFANCNGNANDGCEVNTTNNVNNCGGCNQVCPAFQNATSACQNSQCGMGSCNAGYANCNGLTADGCEIYTPNNVNNCGTCGNVCVTANGTPACVSSQCVIGSCNPGFADCNGNPADGCEVNTTSNVSNCGGCNQACPAFPNATSACQNSQCGIGSCNAGYANCNGLLADGCEINTTNNVNNCGTCGNVCGPIANGTPSCSSSTCTPVCNSGFGNCNGTYGDGCEVNFSNDHNNCGFCGHVCGPMTVCQSGQCFIP